MTFPIALVIIGALLWDAWRRHTNRLGTSKTWATRGDLADRVRELRAANAEALQAAQHVSTEVASLRKELAAVTERAALPREVPIVGLPGRKR